MALGLRLRAALTWAAAPQWALAAFLLAGCADEPPTALLVAIRSEAEVPREIDAIELKVTRRGGEVVFLEHYPVVGGGRVKLPGTLTLQPHQDESASDPVSITVRALLNGRAVVVRRAVVGFSEQKTKLLRMPLQYSCYEFPTACADDETCLGGACAKSAVDAALLPDFSPPLVFGVPGDATCFDASDGACLRQRVNIEDLTKFAAAGCEADLAGGDVSKVNVFVLWKRSVDQGHPRVLDLDAQAGFTIETGRIKLAGGLCDAVKQGAIGKVSYSFACPTKTPLMPHCEVLDQPVDTRTLADSACTRCVYTPPACAAEVGALDALGELSPLTCALRCRYDGHIDSEDECAANRGCFEACVAPLRACQANGTCASYPSELAWAECLAKLAPEATRCAAECVPENVSLCTQGAP